MMNSNQNEYADQNNNWCSNNNNIKNNNNNNNNNNNSSNDGKNKLKYELPSDYKYEVHVCICFRPQKAFECQRCHHYFHGRISEHCKVHPSEFFLMDFRYCPYCSAPITDVRESKLSWEQIRKIEDANLPNDGDDL
ncbi:uncharacterized protein CG13380 [Drosophila montana]|uniref:uncharacterized protein CG13380 n=1 Tax=Drosophila montana TaxID=40370 RepID=UPI00313B2755